MIDRKIYLVSGNHDIKMHSINLGGESKRLTGYKKVFEINIQHAQLHCSCSYFEMRGFPCRHIFACYIIGQFTDTALLPIKSRWTSSYGDRIIGNVIHEIDKKESLNSRDVVRNFTT
jgi:hypothetical protein